MSFVTLIACLAAAAAYDVWGDARRRRRPAERARTTNPAARPAAPAPPAEPDDVERMVTARLVTGQLDPELYRDCMAAIAATSDRASLGYPGSPVDVLDDSADRLVGALPELPPDTVRAAADLAHLGASVEDLVRLLCVTSPQALRIVVVVTGARK